MKRTTKQVLACVMVAAVAITSIVFTPSLSKSAKKPALSKKSAQLEVGKTLKIKVKNANKKAKVTWKSTAKKVVKITKKVSKGKKAYAKVKALSEGSATIKAAYKAGKTKKNLKCKITVKAAADVATDAALTVTTGTPVPTKAAATGTPAPKGSPTKTPTPTKTPKPTKTPGPTAPAKTTFELNANNANIKNEYDNADVTFNNNGSITIVFDNQYEAVNFYLPNTAVYKASKYTKVTIKYTSSGLALGHALYDADCDLSGPDGEGGEAGKHPDWTQQITTGTNVTKTFTPGDGFAGGCIRGIQIFNPDPDNTKTKTTITIQSIVFE